MTEMQSARMCSIENCLSNSNKRISSKTQIEKFELDEGLQPYHLEVLALLFLEVTKGVPRNGGRK